MRSFLREEDQLGWKILKYLGQKSISVSRNRIPRGPTGFVRYGNCLYCFWDRETGSVPATPPQAGSLRYLAGALAKRQFLSADLIA